MNSQTDIDEITLNAFIDGQLGPALQRAVLEAMEADSGIRAQVCRLRRTRDWMQTGFADARPASQPPRLPAASGISRFVLPVVIALASGMAGYLLAGNDASDMAARQEPNRMVLHLDESDPARFRAALDYAEAFLLARHDTRAQVEVVANGGGIDLMRAGSSPYQQRVRQLGERYSNLQFIACANAVRNLHNRGDDVHLAANVKIGSSAIEHIVARLRNGWTYRRVDELPRI